MRNLAQALEMKAPSLYRHYPDKAALEAALKFRGAELLQQTLEPVLSENPIETLRRTANAYLQFSREHPYLYDLMHAVYDTPSIGATKKLWNTVLRVVGGITGNPDDTASSVAFWSFIHGFCSLERTGQFGLSGPKGGFEAGIEALITGFSINRK